MSLDVRQVANGVLHGRAGRRVGEVEEKVAVRRPTVASPIRVGHEGHGPWVFGDSLPGTGAENEYSFPVLRDAVMPSVQDPVRQPDAVSSVTKSLDEFVKKLMVVAGCHDRDILHHESHRAEFW